MKKNNDVFADIAASYNDDNRSGLINPGPPKLKKKYIELNTLKDEYVFTPIKKMDSKEELYNELDILKKEYAPFMKNYAQSLRLFRKSMEIKSFDFRVATNEDKQDIKHVLCGDGVWEKVNIPHYGGPLGVAVTFYRTEFELESIASDKCAFISFKAVDYKAQVYINDNFVGCHEGFYAPFEFDITNVCKNGKNTLVVKVENDYVCQGSRDELGTIKNGDKIYAATGIGWDDSQFGWHHCPPGMGIYNKVFVEIREKEYISDIFVIAKPEDENASVWIEAFNTEVFDKDVTIELSLFGQNFDEIVFENISIVPSTIIQAGVGDTLTEAELKATGKLHAHTFLKIGKGYNRFKIPFILKNPKVWNPDEPWLYQIQVKLVINGDVKDVRTRQFGVRSFVQDTQNEPKGMFYLNGRKIRLRGANTMGHEQQCVAKGDFDQLTNDILLAKLCNMNFLRLTQRPVQEEIYDYCDMLGLMIQTDFPLFGTLRINQFCEGLRQVEEMEKLVRSHPCVIIDTYINEPFPNAHNQPHRELERPELMNFFENADRIVRLHNPDRVIKHVDGDYDPPSETMPDNHCYPMWYNGHGIDIGRLYRGYWLKIKPNWYHGCGEYGAEGLDFVDIMKEYYPKSWLPTSDEYNWTPNSIIMAQTGMFHYFFFDTPHTLNDWVEKGQAHQAFATKLMTEAFRRDSEMITFAIHLFIDAFPSGWMKTIMDFKRNPKPAYFIYKDILNPLIVSLRTDRWTYKSKEKASVEVWVCNDLHEIKGCSINLQVEVDNKVIYSQNSPAFIPECDVEFQGFAQFEIPEVEKRSKAILRAAIVDCEGQNLHDTSMEFNIFPKINYKAKNVMTVGETATELAKQAGYIINEDANTILVTDYDEYIAKKADIDDIVKKGAKLVVYSLPQGIYNIANKEIKVKNCGMHPVFFASRNTTSNIVEGCLEKDFSYWYDEEQGMITPMSYTTFTADNVTPILVGGNKNDENVWDSAMFVAVYTFGKGKVYVSQIELINKLKTNPVAIDYINRLI